jgi:tetratricopeptide (TPR) repeat protein
MPRSSALPTLGVLLALQACGTLGSHKAGDEIAVSLPPATAAWLCADACREALPDADPMPFHAGAPASRDGDCYAVCYEQRQDGRWLPEANGRLRAERSGNLLQPMRMKWEATDALHGCRHPRARVEIHVAPSTEGARVAIDLTGQVPPAVAMHVRNALRFAESLEQTGPLSACCAQHSSWLAIPWLRRAKAHAEQGQLVEARRALQTARSHDPTLLGIDFRIGEIDLALGDDSLAAPRLRKAALESQDPRLQSAASATANEAANRLEDPARGQRLRRDAHRRLSTGDAPSAAALALAALDDSPDPIADLRLRHRLQLAAEDPRAALGTSLLLREYNMSPSTEQLVAVDLQRMGIVELARRAAARAVGRDPQGSDLMLALSGYGEAANATYLAPTPSMSPAPPAR